MPETVELTREELDEAIALLREPEPLKPKICNSFHLDSEKFAWQWQPSLECWKARAVTSDIGWAWIIVEEITEPSHPNYSGQAAAIFDAQLRNTRTPIWFMEQDAAAQFISQCYYEAKTGKRVVVKDE